jgi:hypothetical protein
MRRRHWATMTALAVLAVSAASTACDGDNRPPPLHEITGDYDFTIRPDDSPPHAREDVHYTIQIFDRKTRQPIEHGEGQLFAGKPIYDDAPNGPQSKTWDGLAYDPETGVYRAKLNFVLSGTWAVALRFRRDSLHPLQRIDWMQDVLDENAGSVP